MSLAKAYTPLIVGALWVLSLVGVGYWQYGAATTAERLVWQDKETKRLQALNIENAQLYESVRKTEQRHAADLAAVSAEYQEKLKNEKAKNAHLAADLRSGAVRLRNPTPEGSTGLKAVSEPGTGTVRCAGQEGGELSREAAEFLYTLAADADEVTEQLAACQAVVRADRTISQGEHDD